MQIRDMLLKIISSKREKSHIRLFFETTTLVENRPITQLLEKGVDVLNQEVMQRCKYQTIYLLDQ